jgi:hypothetical protein
MRNGNDPAYPSGNGVSMYQWGLTKRELFAAMAMQGLRACGDPQCPRNSDRIADIAVADADALIAELSK